MLVHLGGGTEDGFRQIGGNLRLCIPDSRCGYLPASTVERLLSLDADPNAASLLSAVLGAYDNELSCWLKQDDQWDQICFRVLEQFEFEHHALTRLLTVATGVALLSGGSPARCAACSVEFMLAHGKTSDGATGPPRPDEVQTVSAPMGAFGIGPKGD